MSKFEAKKDLIDKTDFDTLNKVQIASLFWDAAYAEASRRAKEVLDSYEKLENVKNHLTETLERE